MNIRKLLVGHPIRLRYVQRYNTCRTMHRESVAEHVYYTTLYALILSEWYEKRVPAEADHVSYQRVLRRALVHDFEEAITGDIPRDFKHSSPTMHSFFEKAASKEVFRVLDSVLEDEKQVLVWQEAWLHAKDDSLEGRIIAFADFLSVLSYVYEETRIAKSLVLKEQLTSLEHYGALFVADGYEVFEPLVSQALEIIQEVLHGAD